MSYTPTNWVNNQTPINATNLNKIENELVNLHNKIDSKTDDATNQDLQAMKDDIADLQEADETINQTLQTMQDDIADLQENSGSVGGASNASNVSYDNTDSGLTATNVQSAVDELESELSEVDDKLSQKADTSHSHDDKYYTEAEVDNKFQNVNQNISDINTKLTASNGTVFRFGVDSEGKYGYIVTDSEGADSVIPFKSGAGSVVEVGTLVSLAIGASGNSANSTVTKSGKYTMLAFGENLGGGSALNVTVKKNGTTVHTITLAYGYTKIVPSFELELNNGDVIEVSRTNVNVGIAIQYVLT